MEDLLLLATAGAILKGIRSLLNHPLGRVAERRGMQALFLAQVRVGRLHRQLFA